MARPFAMATRVLDPVRVGALIGTDPAQVHGDDALGPKRGIVEQRIGTSPPPGIEIEREHDALAERRMNLAPNVDAVEALAADHQRGPERQPKGAIGDIGEACIDPQRGAGKCQAQPADQLEMIADAGDGVEIGDIEGRRGGMA